MVRHHGAGRQAPQSVIDTLGKTLKTVSENPEFQRLVNQQGAWTSPSTVLPRPGSSGRRKSRNGKMSSRPPASPIKADLLRF